MYENRLRDLVDVQDLITTLDLPTDFVNRLDPSVRAKFNELWGAAQESRRDAEDKHPSG